MANYSFGAYGTNNVGDEAIFAGLSLEVSGLQQIYVNKAVDDSGVWYADLLEGRVSFHENDHLIIGGGGIFHSEQALSDYLQVATLVKKAGGTVAVRAVGAEGLPREASYVVEELLRLCDIVTARSSRSVKVLSQLTNKRVALERDRALSLRRQPKQNVNFPPATSTHVIGLVTGGQESFGDYAELRHLLSELTVGSGAVDVIHIPHSRSFVDCKNNDVVTGHFLWSSIDIYHARRIERFKLLPFSADPFSVLASYEHLDGLITYRYHGLVFSEIVGCPVLVASCGEKNMSYVEDAGRDDIFVADLADSTSASVVSAFLDKIRSDR